jgi:hypothetical protein
MHTPTIHNPTNFNPADYEINGYFDNRPPRKLPGWTAERFQKATQEWEMERDELFPDHNDHACQHCGQTNVRFVISCEHIPTRKSVCIGDICVARLNFPDYDKFQAARVRQKAAAEAKELKKAKLREAFLAGRPELKKAIDKFNKSPEKFSSFAHSVVANFNHWGNMTERQETAFINSLKWVDNKSPLEKIKENQRKTSRHVGKIGERIAFDNAEIKFTKPTQTSFGPSNFTVIEDCAGNVVISFKYLGEKGDKVSFTAKVKEHGERDGVKQTVVNYPKLGNETEDLKGSNSYPDPNMIPF